MNNCEELQNRLSEYVDGVLDKERTAELQAHLQECEACRQLLADLRRTVALIQDIPDVDPPKDLLSKIHAQLEGDTAPSRASGEDVTRQPLRFSNFFSSPQVRVAVAAGLLVFVGVYGMIQMKAPRDLSQERASDSEVTKKLDDTARAKPQPAALDEIAAVEKERSVVLLETQTPSRSRTRPSRKSAPAPKLAARADKAKKATQNAVHALKKAQPKRALAPAANRRLVMADSAVAPAEQLKPKRELRAESPDSVSGAAFSATSTRIATPPPAPRPTSLSAEADGKLWRHKPARKAATKAPEEAKETKRRAPRAMAPAIAAPLQSMAPGSATSGARATANLQEDGLGNAGGGKGRGLAMADTKNLDFEAATADSSHPDISHAGVVNLTIAKAKHSDVLNVVNKYRTPADLQQHRAQLKKLKKKELNVVTITLSRVKYQELLRDLNKLGQIAVNPITIEGQALPQTRTNRMVTAKNDATTITLHIRIIE